MAPLDTKIVMLPDLINSCPYKHECNPNYEAVSIETDAWLSSHGIPHTESETKFNLFSALFLPRASRTRLRDVCDACTLAIIIDDVIDASVTTGISDLSKRQLYNNMIECFQPAGSFKPLTLFASAFHDWWQRILVNATPDSQRRIKAACLVVHEAYLIQTTDKSHQIVPDLKTYINIRRESVFGRILCGLFEYALDVHLPDECLANETLKSLMECMVDIVGWVNDVYSFNIEQSHGQYNLISVLMHDNPLLSIQQAMDYAGELVINRYADFELIRPELPSWGTEIDDQVQKYVEGLTAGISANAFWCLETPKYFGEQREEVKRTKCFKLLPSKTTVQGNFIDLEKDEKIMLNGNTNINTAHRLSDVQGKMNLESNGKDISVPVEILEPFDYVRALPSKKIRSKMISAFNHWFKVSYEKLNIIDEIIDMLHNASLLIDDIEDGSDLRRSSPAAHIIYGIPLTINAAELTCVLSLQKAFALNDSRAERIVVARLIELHIGQGNDIWWRDNHICPTEENYCQMVIRKCGGLFQMALDLLKICSSIELNEETNKAINDLCKNLGLLFQIRDDYCNLVSNEYALSKSYCEDLSEGKYSFPVIHAIQSRPNDTRIRNVLKKRTNNDSLKREIVRLLHEFGSIEYTKNKCIKLADECQALIDKLEAGVQFQVILNQLTAIFDDLAQNGTK